MYKKQIISVFILLIFFNINISLSNNTINSYLYVHSRAGLNIRESANINSKIITLIPYGEKVEVLTSHEKKSKFTSENISGYFVKIKYNSFSGYVFDGYLSLLPAPKEDFYSIKDYSYTYIGKIGNIIELKPNKINNETGHYIQKLNLESQLEIIQHGNCVEHILSIPDISIKDAFLLVRNLDKNFRSIPFKLVKNKIQITADEAIGYSLMVYQDNKYTKILVIYCT